MRRDDLCPPVSVGAGFKPQGLTTRRDLYPPVPVRGGFQTRLTMRRDLAVAAVSNPTDDET